MKRDNTTSRKEVEEMRRDEISALRDTDPAIALTGHFGASLAPGSAGSDRTRMFVLPSGSKVGVKPAENGGFVWTVNGSGRGGRGCINLVCEIERCDVRKAVEILSGMPQPPRAPSVRQPLPLASAPAADADRWPGVRRWLTEVRGLPRMMVDHMHTIGKVWADERANAVFPRANDGAFVRGIGPAPFRRTVGGKSCGPFVIEGPRHVVIVESAIDAFSVKSMAPDVHVLATGGALLTAQDLVRYLPAEGRPVVIAFDNDSAGGEYTRLSKIVWPDARVRVPDAGKDWNDLMRLQPGRISARWH